MPRRDSQKSKLPKKRPQTEVRLVNWRFKLNWSKLKLKMLLPELRSWKRISNKEKLSITSEKSNKISKHKSMHYIRELIHSTLLNKLLTYKWTNCGKNGMIFHMMVQSNLNNPESNNKRESTTFKVKLMDLEELLRASTRKSMDSTLKEIERKPKLLLKPLSLRTPRSLKKINFSSLKLKTDWRKLSSNWNTMNLKLLETTSQKMTLTLLRLKLNNSLKRRSNLIEPFQMLRVNLPELLKILRLLMPSELS